ncbi:MAG: protein kinase [Balneolales bacterium]
MTLNNKYVQFNIEKYASNVINIDNTDYLPYYLDNENPGNKGSNSFIIKLIKVDNFDDEIGYPENPDCIMKICKRHKKRYDEEDSSRFSTEINALKDCNEKLLQNVVKVHHSGVAKIYSKSKNKYFDYRFYTMDYAESDLSFYLENKNMSLFDRVGLCIEICESLNQLRTLGYYHRDIKPDNILFIDNKWMISDLGLVDNMNDDVKHDLEKEWIGPRGWMSPEAMNKFLTEAKPWEELFDCNIDHQSDIYQLGKVLWFILQGNTPEGGIRRGDFLWKNEQIYQTVRTMLNQSKSKRYNKIQEVIDDLKRGYKKIFKKDDYFLYN